MAWELVSRSNALAPYALMFSFFYQISLQLQYTQINYIVNTFVGK